MDPTADVYTWQQPITGPVRYFCNGEFVLQTAVPEEELERMLAEEQAARPKPATPPVRHTVPQVPIYQGVPVQEPKAAPATLPPRINKEQGSEKPRINEKDKQSLPAATPVTPEANILRHADSESQTLVSTLPDARKEQSPAPPPATPQRIIREQFKGAFREVLVEILLEKFSSQVTAADVMERLEARNG